MHFSRLERRVVSVKLIRMKNWIVADPEHLGGSPRVRDTRISVALILESLAAGMSVAKSWTLVQASRKN